MKYTNKWLLALIPAAFLSSCAEDVFEPYQVDKPASIAELEYLKNYQELKAYTGNLNVGAVVDASKYAGKTAVFGLASSNFSEITGGTSTMHVNMVRDNGSANTLNFLDMVSAAQTVQQPIFGSALLSNTNQNTKYLTNILKDKVDPNFVPVLEEITAHDDSRCIKVPATAKKSQPWDNQFWLAFDHAVSGGESFEINMTIRADKAAEIGCQLHKKPSQYLSNTSLGAGNIPFTTEWTPYTFKGTFAGGDADGESFAFNLNSFEEANNYYFKDVSLKINGTETIINGDLATDDVTSFFSKIDDGEVVSSDIVDGYDYTYMGYAPTEVTVEYNKPVLVVNSQDKAEQVWDTQFWIVFEDNPISLGDTWECYLKVRADKPAKASTQVHKSPGSYICGAGIGDVEFTTEWTEYTNSGTFVDLSQYWAGNPEGGYSIAFNLNEFDKANTYYFASISLKINGKEVIKNVDLKGSDNSNFAVKEYPAAGASDCPIQPSASWIVQKDTPGIPLTDEEKHDTINYALKYYVQNMMNASQGYVKAWDVIADVLTADGLINDAEGGNNFNWSAYLGEEDFARLAVKYARESFAAAGGSASDLKLFINESGLDNAAKLDALKSWIAKWEADGTTKFDGISTVIKTSFSEDAATLQANEEYVVKLLTSLKETGLLVRIAGIDLEYLDASGATVKNSELTVEQGKKLGEFYAFILKKYNELIPDAQRYGLFINNVTDNGDTPGLWSESFSRKPVYGGFADGLK